MNVTQLEKTIEAVDSLEIYRVQFSATEDRFWRREVRFYLMLLRGVLETENTPGKVHPPDIGECITQWTHRAEMLCLMALYELDDPTLDVTSEEDTSEEEEESSDEESSEEVTDTSDEEEEVAEGPEGQVMF